jgi:hypothetical protein
VSTKTHWATGVADTSLHRDDVEQQRARAAAQLRNDLERTVATEGAAFVDRVEGELRSTAEAFNVRVGRPLLDVHRSPSSVASIRSRDDGGYVLFVPDFNTTDGNTPGVTVTVRQWSRDRVDPYPFLVHNDRLHIQVAGTVTGPEGFVRQQLEPWLQALPLGGR